MKAKKKFDRKRLTEIVESYGGTMSSFDDQPPDTYEQVLAAHSLEQLDLFYSELFAPGRNTKKASKACPPWPRGARNAGRRPCRKVLQRIYKRIKTDRSLGILVEQDEHSRKFMQTARRFLPKEELRALDKIITSMSQEIMARKLKGIPISEQLPPVDRLLTRQKLAQRSREHKLQEKKHKTAERKQMALEKRGEAAGNKEAQGTAVTKEEWEQMERDLKLL